MNHVAERNEQNGNLCAFRKRDHFIFCDCLMTRDGVDTHERKHTHPRSHIQGQALIV